MTDIALFSILVTLAAAVLLSALRMRLQTRPVRRVPAARRAAAAPASPLLSPGELEKVFDDAEKAAAHKRITGLDGVNPHEYGSRAFVLWVTHYHAVLMGLRG